jgi:NAD(P)-dependent dehydrogenase (short-subunit alcohol dehydrogenase family)
VARQEVEPLGGKAMVLPVDVADAGAVDAAAAWVEEAFGPIDIWVNNAMVSVLSPIYGSRPIKMPARTVFSTTGRMRGAFISG